MRGIALLLVALAILGSTVTIDQLGSRYLDIKAKEIDYRFMVEERKFLEAKHQMYLNCMAHPTWNKKQKAKNCYDKRN